MKYLPSSMLQTLTLLSALGLASCGDSSSDAKEPKTPEEMYERAGAVLKPNAENDASDYTQAIAWLKKAADAGYLKAQTDLGGLYFGGGAVKADWDEAYRWFSKAAEQGSAAAHHFLGIIYDKGTLRMASDAKKAMDHWKIAADAGIPEAMHHVGHVLLRGESSLDEGLRYLEKAADAGVAKAASELGYLYATGFSSIQKDENKALEWLQKAAGYGDPKALYIVACCYQTGDGLPKDEQKALVNFRLSAGQDFVPAMQSLVTILSFDDASDEMRQEAEAWKARIVEVEDKLKKDAEAVGHDVMEAAEKAPVTPMLVP